MTLAGWRIIQDPPGEPQFNMDRDEALAESVRRGPALPTLRLYGWTRPAVSLGRRQLQDDLPLWLLRKNLPVVRRPTGGGAVVHCLDELTYSVAIPERVLSGRPFRLKQLPQLLHQCLRDFLIKGSCISSQDLRLVQAGSDAPAPLCFSAPVSGDLVYRKQKVAGSALRAWREAVLIQGSIQGLPLSRDLLAGLLTHAARSL